MRVLFTTQPGFGHLNPVLPYAAAMRHAGHEVRFASSPSFAEAIERHGFPVVEVGEDFTWERVNERFPDIDDAARVGRAMEYATFDIGWDHWFPKALQDLLALFEQWRPDLIVREYAENAGLYAGEIAGVPVVCAAWGAVPTDGERWRQAYDWERWIAAHRQTRADLGLPADPPGGGWTRQLTLSPLPPSWVDAPDDGNTARHFRVPLAEGPTGQKPSWLASMGQDRPLVYATLGTVYNKMRRLRTAVLDAMADLDADVLMTVGRDVDPADVETVPSNVRIEPFVAQSLVLPQASLVVSHAGLGTLLGAVYQGVPMVVVAIAGDQVVNAQRASELGFGVALDRSEAQAQALHEGARRALGEPSFATAAAALREECDAMEPIEAAVTALEEIAAAGPGG